MHSAPNIPTQTLGKEDGSFRASVAYPTGDPDSTAVVAGDFNGSVAFAQKNGDRTTSSTRSAEIFTVSVADCEVRLAIPVEVAGG